MILAPLLLSHPSVTSASLPAPPRPSPSPLPSLLPRPSLPQFNISIITITTTTTKIITIPPSVTSWTSSSQRVSCRPGRTLPTTSTMPTATPMASVYPMVTLCKINDWSERRNPSKNSMMATHCIYKRKSKVHILCDLLTTASSHWQNVTKSS